MVPIVVALIAALGVVIAAIAPSLLNSNGVPSTGQPTTSHAVPAPFEYKGVATMRRTDPEVDLDLLSNGTGGDNAADLIHTTMALTTSRNAKAVLLDRAQQLTPDTCRSALTGLGTNKIAVSQMEPGLSLCIRTTAGRMGVVTVDHVGTYPAKYGESLLLGQIQLSYWIWSE